MTVQTAPLPSSRVSAAGAGWEACAGPGRWREDVPVNTKPLSWLRPSTLWQSRNDIIARHVSNPVDQMRVAWVRQARVRAQATGADQDFVFRLGDDDASVSLLVAGDTGEGDASQYCVVPALVSQSAGVATTVICSDVIYPTGDIGDYRDKFFRPYRALETPILAMPGNHDWYDGLHGFMEQLTGLQAPAEQPGGPGWRGAVTRRFWRRTPAATQRDLDHMRALRSRPEQVLDPPQPGPYWAFDAGPLRFVAIDTGIVGWLDADQGAWLRRVSAVDRPKVLLTGKPLYVDNKREPCQIEGGGTVDDIVRDPAMRYVAAIGGDIHNYQRYLVALPDGRLMQYVVSGGGGAFMHATHRIPKISLEGTSEDAFKCYPLRGDSLARYSQLYDHKLARDSGLLRLDPAEASTYMAELLELDPTRGTRVPLSGRARFAAHLIQPIPASHGFHRFVSEAFDWNDPPMFKSFLRLDASGSELRIRCFGVSGCAGTEDAPPVEDEFTVRW